MQSVSTQFKWLTKTQQTAGQCRSRSTKKPDQQTQQPPMHILIKVQHTCVEIGTDRSSIVLAKTKEGRLAAERDWSGISYRLWRWPGIRSAPNELKQEPGVAAHISPSFRGYREVRTLSRRISENGTTSRENNNRERRGSWNARNVRPS